MTAFGPIMLRTTCSEGTPADRGEVPRAPRVRAIDADAVGNRLPVQALSSTPALAALRRAASAVVRVPARGTPAQGRVSIRVSTAR